MPIQPAAALKNKVIAAREQCFQENMEQARQKFEQRLEKAVLKGALEAELSCEPVLLGSATAQEALRDRMGTALVAELESLGYQIKPNDNGAKFQLYQGKIYVDVTFE
jgi:hypothetical protein